MAKGGNTFDEHWFLSRGYTSDNKGGFNPPKFRNPLIDLKTEPTILKHKINNSPAFEAKSVTEWFIPYQIPSKKNCQQLYIKTVQGGRQIPSTTTSKRFKDYVSVTKKYWETFGIEFRSAVNKLKLTPPLVVEFTFIRSTLQKVDYVGPLESVQDIMQDFGWIENDDYFNLKPILGDMEVDKNNPGVRIKLLINK